MANAEIRTNQAAADAERSVAQTAIARLATYRNLAVVTVIITLGLIMLGAGVRLTDAGLGCPDWPGCYGQLTPVHAQAEIAQAVAAQGGEHGPVSMGKAWREMIHRYIAMGLGLLIIGLAVLGWKWRRDLPGTPWLATVLVGVVILQGLFGKWTVTLLLKPAIVTGHLLGGMLTLALLVWLWRRVAEYSPGGIGQTPLAARRPISVAVQASQSDALVRPTGKEAGQILEPPTAGLKQHVPVNRGFGRLQLALTVGLVALVMQISLGGWTSTNYAALACTDFPLCQGKWVPDADFTHAFHLIRPLGQTPDGDPISFQALTAIHFSHRIGALVTTGALLWLIMLAWPRPGLRALAGGLTIALIVQILLGISNVVYSLPLSLAVAHNGGAAVLLMVLVMLKFRIWSKAREG